MSPRRRKTDDLSGREPKTRFEELPPDVLQRLAERGIDPDRSLQEFLLQIRASRPTPQPRRRSI